MSGIDCEFGVIYSVFGKTFISLAEESARSVKTVMPECQVALFSDLGSNDSAIDLHYSKHESDKIRLRKVDNLLRSPFEKTLLLDGDTYVIEPLDPLFELLDSFDLVVSHAPNRNPFAIKGIPESFPELNCGVIGIRNNEKTREFLHAWDQNYRLIDSKREQPCFRKTLFESNLRFFILTTEYNYRTNFPGAVGEGEKVRILHGKGNDMRALAGKINQQTDARVSLLSFNDYFSGKILRIRPITGVLKEYAVLTIQSLKKFLSGGNK